MEKWISDQYYEVVGYNEYDCVLGSSYVEKA